MFDFDAGKLLIIGVVALVVIGPKDLPRVLRQVGQAVGRLRRMASEFQGQFMDAMKEADIQDIRDDLAKLGNDAQLNVNFDPVRDIRSELTQAVAPTTSVETTAEVSHTEGFELPKLATAMADETSSLASAGLAPVVNEEVGNEVMLDGLGGGAHELAASKKRKILVKKRTSLPVASHSVSDRTGAAKIRTVRLRRHEAIER